MKVLSLFSGIGAFEKALERLNIDYELVNYCDIDKYAAKAFSLIHNVSEDLNLGDITKVSEKVLPDFDLITWGFPCTDISGAGKQKGFVDEDGNKTRSGLYYDGLRILKEKKPKYSIIENVKALTQKKFKKEFEQILKDLEDLGYTNYYQVLNAKNYGIPQNRERVFIISILGEHKLFEFPEGFDNGLRLKDLLEDNVDEKYYISQEKTNKLIGQLKEKEKYMNTSNAITSNYRNSLANDEIKKCRRQVIVEDVILTGQYNQKDGFTENEFGCTIDASVYKGLGCNQNRNAVAVMQNDIIQVGMFNKTEMRGHELIRRIYSPDGISPTLDSMSGGNRQPKVLEPNVLRFERTEYGKEVRKDYEARLIDEKIGNMRIPVPRTDGISNTITAVLKDNMLAEPKIVAQRGRYDENGNIEQQFEIQEGDFTNTITTVQKDNMVLEPQYRIRKLTPLECFRLMGFDDQDYYILKENGISNSQIYKMAGNSIVVNVLEAIFKNLFNT